ncbi:MULTISPECIES: bS18 family ribosomal protein [Holospora]|uniref:30S ribosomal protein S18 n=2 Tax=Holospora TaxID=44747 RepID=A0A061JHD2_9PROT|nr:MULTISPECIES: 30S ribosomal protein S18 [Holospora]ETZ04668.1 30S ribosomal protein S18 [Holospora undulata HU1]GAJ45855.1 30S ribosomal protein S18 [Holospora elegans E1]
MNYMRKKYIRSLKESEINFKNLKLLNRSVTDSGRITPGRLIQVDRRMVDKRSEEESYKKTPRTFSNAKRQKSIANAVKIARYLALIPYKK